MWFSQRVNVAGNEKAAGRLGVMKGGDANESAPQEDKNDGSDAQEGAERQVVLEG